MSAKMKSKRDLEYVKLQIRLPVELRKRLRIKLVEEGKNETEFILSCIRNYLSE